VEISTEFPCEVEILTTFVHLTRNWSSGYAYHWKYFHLLLALLVYVFILYSGLADDRQTDRRGLLSNWPADETNSISTSDRKGGWRNFCGMQHSETTVPEVTRFTWWMFSLRSSERATGDKIRDPKGLALLLAAIHCCAVVVLPVMRCLRQSTWFVKASAWNYRAQMSLCCRASKINMSSLGFFVYPTLFSSLYAIDCQCACCRRHYSQ